MVFLWMETWWGRDFLHLSRTTVRKTQHPPQCVPSLFLRVNQPWRGVGNHPLQSPKLKYIGKHLPPFWMFMYCSKRNFTFTGNLPILTLLIYPQGQSPVVWVALYECDLHFKSQWLLYVPSVLKLKFLPFYIPCFQQPDVQRLQSAVKTGTAAASASVLTTANVKFNCYRIQVPC